MKKFATLVLLILISLAAYPQKEIFSLLENESFQDIQDPDSVFQGQDLVHHMYVYITPKFEFFNKAYMEVLPGGMYMNVKWERFGFSFTENWDLPDTVSGFLKYNEESALKLKYGEEFGVDYVHVCLLNVHYYGYPDQELSYSYKLYADGRLKVYYGPSTVNPNLSSFKDKMISITNPFPHENGYLIITEDYQNPTLYDHTDDYWSFKDSFKPFPHPPTNFAFQLNLFGATTGLEEVNAAEIEMEIAGAVLNLSLPTTEPVVLEIVDMQGRTLLSEKHSSLTIKRDLNLLSKGAYVIRVLKDDEPVFIEKVQL